MSPSTAIIRGCWISLVVLFALASTGGAQTTEQQLQETRDRLEQARAAHLDLIAPKHFEEAERHLTSAEERYARGGRLEDIGNRLLDARQRLSRAEALREVGEVLLREAIAARGAALKSNAPKYATRPWNDAEEALRDAGRKVEGGDQNGARREAVKAVTGFRDAELRAIRTDLLGTAQQYRADAIEVEADELAALTLGEADSLMAAAEATLINDRYNTDEVRRLAEQATEEFLHARRIAEAIHVMNEDSERNAEKLIRHHEKQVARIARALQSEPRFSDGVVPVAEEILAAIASMRDDRNDLQAKLSDVRAQLEEREQRLAKLEQRDDELREREQREQRIDYVRSIFDPNEAVVTVANEKLTVNLVGLRFPSGSAVIRPENFALLTKLLRVVREFPRRPVSIEGHTDSIGNDDYNQDLSQRRASAVREYLLANLDSDPTWFSAVGYGEARPVASNDSESGRARNRRIEVVVDLLTP